MASCAFMVRLAVAVLVVAVISHTASHRLSGHPYFQHRTVTAWSPSTQQPTQSVVIDDKMPGPSVKYPPYGQSFLDYLVHRDTYFDKVGSVNRNITSTTTELTSTRRPDYTTTLPESQPTSTRTKSAESTSASTSTTTTTPISTTTSTTTTTPTSTTTPTTTTTPTSTTTPTTTSKYPPQQLPFNDNPQAQIKDRLSRYQLADLWLKRLKRPSILDPAHSRVRSGDADPGPTTGGKVNALSTNPSLSNSNQNHGVVEIDPYGGVYIVYNKQTQATRSTLTIGDKMAPTPPTAPTSLDVQDKPFYGSSLGQYFDDDRLAENNVTDSRTNQTADKRSGRHRRAADNNDTSCSEPQQFQPCQYYNQCFRALSDACSSRNSFLGSVFSRFCSRTIETSKSAKNQLLSSYLTEVELCMRQGFSNIVEYPSCADVTWTVQDSLFLKRNSSCLYQRDTFCKVLEDDVARPSLARMFNSTNDVQFMFRVVVNMGNLASYCRGQGASIFVTDITMLVTSKDSPYSHLVGNTPVPGIVQKN